MATTNDVTVSKILVVIAMAAEAAPLIEHLELQKLEDDSLFPAGSPWQIHQGSHDGITVDVVSPGKDAEIGVDNVGTVPSSVLTYAAIQAFKPDVVINAGTAGGFQSRGAAIGDVYVATHIANHDRRISIPGFDKYGIGLRTGFSSKSLLEAANLKEGKVSSGNSFDLSPEDQTFIDSNEAVVKDMESAGVAWVTSLLGIPIIVIKSVTDIVDAGRPSHDEFLENLATAAASLQKTLPLIIAHIGGKKLSDV